MKKKLIPIISSIALILGSYNTVYASEDSEQTTTFESSEENTVESVDSTEESTDLASTAEESLATEAQDQSSHENDADIESNEDTESIDEIVNEYSESEIENNSEESDTEDFSDDISDKENTDMDEEDLSELEDDEEELEDEFDEDDTEEIETCKIHITCKKEEYEIINLCPTENIIISSTEASISIAKGEDFQTVFEGTILNEDLAEKINLPETIQEDYEISFYINIEGDITSNMEAD